MLAPEREKPTMGKLGRPRKSCGWRWPTRPSCVGCGTTHRSSEKRWHQRGLCRRPVMACRRTYVKIKGVWHYLYHAVDRLGRTVDFRLSARRDVAAAKAFFRKTIKSQRSAADHHIGWLSSVSSRGAGAEIRWSLPRRRTYDHRNISIT